jgi:uncharacterized membrane protein
MSALSGAVFFVWPVVLAVVVMWLWVGLVVRLFALALGLGSALVLRSRGLLSLVLSRASIQNSRNASAFPPDKRGGS